PRDSARVLREQAALPGHDAAGSPRRADCAGAATPRTRHAGAESRASAGPPDCGLAVVDDTPRAARCVSDAVRAGRGAQDVPGAGGRRPGPRVSDGAPQPNQQVAWTPTGLQRTG